MKIYSSTFLASMDSYLPLYIRGIRVHALLLGGFGCPVKARIEARSRCPHFHSPRPKIHQINVSSSQPLQLARPECRPLEIAVPCDRDGSNSARPQLAATAGSAVPPTASLFPSAGTGSADNPWLQVTFVLPHMIFSRKSAVSHRQSALPCSKLTQFAADRSCDSQFLPASLYRP